MQPYDIEQTEMHFNNVVKIFACVVVLLMIIGGAYLQHQEQKKISVTTETEVVISTSDTATMEKITTTIPEETTTPEISTIPEETTTTNTTIEVTEPDFMAPGPEPEITTPEPPAPEPYLTLTESERLILATLIRLECGGSSYECQMAVASVVINRMNMWGLTLRQAVFQKNVFSPADLIDPNTGASNYPPYETCWQVVDDICANGPTLPYYVIYFRSEYYHEWATPYAHIGSLYFSYAEKHM